MINRHMKKKQNSDNFAKIKLKIMKKFQIISKTINWKVIIGNVSRMPYQISILYYQINTNIQLKNNKQIKLTKFI